MQHSALISFHVLPTSCESCFFPAGRARRDREKEARQGDTASYLLLLFPIPPPPSVCGFRYLTERRDSTKRFEEREKQGDLHGKLQSKGTRGEIKNTQGTGARGMEKRKRTQNRRKKNRIQPTKKKKKLSQKKTKKLTSPGSSTLCFTVGSGSSALRLISSSKSGRPRKNLWCENSHVCASVEVLCARGVYTYM